MFAGNKVFNLMFKASEHGYNGTEYQGINNKNFHFWLTTFENVLADIADEFNPEIFSAFEYWFKWIKTMINMYKMNNKQTAELNFKNPIDAVGARDIDHYYLSISQEKLPYNEIKNLSKEEIFSKITETRKIWFWWFNPSLWFKRIIEHSPRNIILASYALSPFLSYETELKTRFAIQHESNHIIEKDQVNVTILKKAIKGRTFNFSYKERDWKDIAKDLGYTIIEICKVTPGGIVIVFQSSGFMRQITTLWDTYGISRSISQIKQIFIEPKENQNVKFALPEYYKAALNSGGMLIVSSTGIVVEGLDLSDDAARTIVQIGIPFPNLGDPKTIMKKEYLDKLKLIKKDHNALNGQKWYLLQAARDVNHLIGKIATHKHDYGNIILLDDRYWNSQQRNQFTHWLKHNIKIEDDILKWKKNFKQFFQNMKEKNLIPKIKRFDQIRLNYSHMDQNEYLFELSEIVKKAAEAYDLKFGYLKTPKVNFKSEDPKIKIEKVEAKSKQKQEKSKSKTLSQKSKSSSKWSRKNSKSVSIFILKL